MDSLAWLLSASRFGHTQRLRPEVAVQELQSKARGAKALTIAVLYFPLHAVALTDSSTVLLRPTLGRLSQGGREAESSGQQQASISEETEMESKMLAHALIGFAAALGYRLETYSLGTRSAILGRHAPPHQATPAKTAPISLNSH